MDGSLEGVQDATEVERLSVTRLGGEHETALVAEDHDMVREMVVPTLEAHGYRVLAAASGHEALERLARREAAPDPLLADIVMPRMSGLELAATLLAERPDLPVLYMSDYREQHAARQLSMEGDIYR